MYNKCTKTVQESINVIIDDQPQELVFKPLVEPEYKSNEQDDLVEITKVEQKSELDSEPASSSDSESF